MKRKTTIIAAILLILLLLFVLISLIVSRGRSPQQNQTPTTPSPVQNPAFPPISQTEGNRILVSGIAVNDFTKTARKDENTQSFYLVENDEFEIAYIPQFEQFSIYIMSSPFPKLQREAERELLRILGVGISDACQLNIESGTPYEVNPDYSGAAYPLSLCSQ